MEKEGARLLILIILEIPLVISLFFLIKALITHTRKLRTLTEQEEGFKKEKYKLIIYFLLMLLVFMLGSVLFILPHLALALIFMVFYSTILGFLYSILGFFRGLGNVKGAGGSPYNILLTLKEYISEYFNLKGSQRPSKGDNEDIQEK